MQRSSENTEPATSTPYYSRAAGCTLLTSKSNFRNVAYRFGRLSIEKIRSSPGTARRSQAMVEDDHRAHHAIVHVKRGLLTLHHCGREAHCATGGSVLIDYSRPFEMSIHEAGTYIWTFVPSDALSTRLPDYSTVIGTAIAPSPFNRGIIDLVESLGHEKDLDSMESWLGSTAVIDLTVALLHRQRVTLRTEADQDDEMRIRAMESIEVRFTDHRLTVFDVAADLGIGARRLHSLFESTEHSVYARIRRRRIDRAMSLLSDISQTAMSIEQIARRSGFAGSTQLDRAIKQFTGTSPRALRRQLAEDSSP